MLVGFDFYTNAHICITDNNIFEDLTQKSDLNHRRRAKVPLHWTELYFQAAFLDFELPTLIQIDVTYVERLKWKDV